MSSTLNPALQRVVVIVDDDEIFRSRLCREVKIIMLTGYGSIATALTAIKIGADDYMSKPADVDQIVAAYEKLFHHGPTDLATYHASDVPSLARVEWEHIQRVLNDCDGNVSQAARLLGLHRRSLQRKLERYPPHR